MKQLVKRSHAIRIIAALGMVGLWLFFSSNDLSISTPGLIKAEAGARETQDGAAAPSAADLKNDARLKEIEKQTIMPLMGDDQVKKEVGRASWKYFHTLLARFPDEPTPEEREKLSTFIELYAELYPCGECSYHFVKLIEKFPIQTSSRTAAAMWGCHIHNKVNEFLKKVSYDCSTILADYDCGCSDSDGKKVSLEKEAKQLG
ncbi:erv2p [Saccharomyces arboricola H-6]|uniref:Sulfhydryl oxidase n=1 Tax=Saccharomyces arboricola (strain H-6 / AS 2.3317 / CBS 10644) TaxID=1160507 RepID=J8Q113_SACAR|nr:erv2p [Saccharomyces arboricola H-6]